MFTVKNLSKQRHNKTILNDLSFTVDHGKVAIFLGGSGAGKSTLLRVLNSLESYSRGAFFLDGAELNLADVNRDHTVGMVFQHFNLFEHLNAEENIMLALIKCKGLHKREAEGVAKRLLDRYGLLDKAKASVHKLSGGQKQRLAIARTLALDPKIVCLDEPTSALDPRLTIQVSAFIKELANENRIVLLTTHDMGLIEQLDGQLFLLENGSIVENATKNEISSDSDQFPKLHLFLNPV